jgi:hypothetical protein
MRLNSYSWLLVAAVAGTLTGVYLTTRALAPAGHPVAAGSPATRGPSEPGVRNAAERYGAMVFGTTAGSAPGRPLSRALTGVLGSSVAFRVAAQAGAVPASHEPWNVPAAPGITPLAPPTHSEPVQPPPADSGTTTTPAAPPPPPVEVTDVRQVSLSSFSATIAWHTSEPVASRIGYGLDGPTLWTAREAPSTEHTATLHGLTFDASYRFWVAARADDGRTTSAPFALTTPGLDDGVTAGTKDSAFVVDGEPFFPTIVWHACADSYPAHLAAGIDLFMGNGCGTAAAQLGQLRGHALSVADAHGAAAAGPGLAGSFLPDEWDLHLPGNLSSAEAGRLAASSSPGPRFLTLTNHFYSHATPLPQGRALYPPLVANAEVVGFDLYPLQSWCRWDSFGDVFSSQQELVQLAAGKPTFQWVEARRMDCSDPKLDPTPETVRAETWLAIAGGAHGIGYFPADWSPDIGAEIAREKREIGTLVPALVQPALAAHSDAPTLNVGARELNGAVYVVVVNASREAASGNVTVDALGSRQLVSLDGARSVASAGGSFRETLAPLEVRIYVAAPASL